MKYPAPAHEAARSNEWQTAEFSNLEKPQQ
jgi:hypothetical protein